MEAKKPAKIRIYCPEHQVGFDVEKDSDIYCQKGDHHLATEFPPQKDFWEYCCGCQRFMPFSISRKEKEKTHCLSCEKKVEKRFLCHRCQTFSIDSLKGKDKKYRINADGSILNDCPACSAATKRESLHLHECNVLKITFYTSRMICKFCEKNVFQIYQDKINDLLWLLDKLVTENKQLKDEMSKASNKIKAIENYSNELYSFSDHLGKKSQYLDQKLSVALNNSSPHINLNEIDVKDAAKSFTLPDETLKTINLLSETMKTAETRLSVIEKTVVDLSAVSSSSAQAPQNSQTFSSNIQNFNTSQSLKLVFPLFMRELDRIPNKIPLTKYPLTPNYLMPAKQSDTTNYYLLIIKDRFFAFPSNYFVKNEIEFNNFRGFYNTIGTISGEIIIDKPAEVKWDVEKQGWQLIEKGMMKFRG